MMQKIRAAIALMLAFAAPLCAQSGPKRRPLPYQYGRVILNNYTTDKTWVAPVVFDHWRHRAKFTCRLCHVDIGFMMKAGGTGIRAADNMSGYYCGACHGGKALFDGNGKALNDGKPVFAACSNSMTENDRLRCERCHSQGISDKSDADFLRFAQPLPKERFGNGLDWQQAEEQGMIHPVDIVKGISMAKKPMALPKEKEQLLTAKVVTMPNIIFSHQKHTVWNGCESCHPDPFASVKKGELSYTMSSIFQGKFCGTCHTSVAFPLTNCQRCHSTPVGP